MIDRFLPFKHTNLREIITAYELNTKKYHNYIPLVEEFLFYAP